LRSLKKYSVTLLNVVGLPKSSPYQSWVFPEPALPQNGMLMVAPSIGPVRLVGPYAWVSCAWSTKEADGVAPRARIGVGGSLWSGVMSSPAFWELTTTRSLVSSTSVGAGAPGRAALCSTTAGLSGKSTAPVSGSHTG